VTQYNLFYDGDGDESAAHQELAQHGTWSLTWWEPTSDDAVETHALILETGYLIRRVRAEARHQVKREQRSHIMRVEHWAHLEQVAEEVGALAHHGSRAGAAGHPVPSWRTLLLKIGTGWFTVVRTDKRGELCDRVALWLAGVKLPPRLARQRKAVVRALRAMDPGELGELGLEVEDDTASL